MNLPVFTRKNIAEFLSREEVIRETVEQVMKDFALFGLEITFSGNTAKAYEEIHQQLIVSLTDLYEKQGRKLVALLYQIDIGERDIERGKQEIPDYSHIEVVAHQIIERELKKVMTRHYFKAQKR